KCTHGSVHLQGTGSHLIGEIEVCNRGVWSTVCGEEWDDNDATVICKQLGLSPYGAIAVAGSVRYSEYPMRLFGSQCQGNENRILDCSINQTQERVSYEQCQQYKAGVICQSSQAPYSSCTTGDIRLVGGTTAFEGRVEVCISNVWGTVCDDGWTVEDSNVACKKAGYQAFGSMPNDRSSYGSSDLSILLTRLQCTGREDSLLDCNKSLYHLLNCHNSRLAGVKCKELCTDGDIRIVGDTSSSPSYGRVDLCVSQTWGTICDSSWTDTEASVVCKQQGFSPYGAKATYGSHYGFVFGQSHPKPVLVSDIQCTGSEFRLLDCTRGTYSVKNCGRRNEAGVTCLGSFPVFASKTIGKVFGGEQVFIRGPDFKSGDTINCIFGDIVTEGYFINGEKCLCITPEQYNVSLIELTIRITRGSAVLTGRTKYRY
uniref:SRCR domain-containing protein n=1 Tax=Amphimedon queenslandica TaxID=400682 RepID=A0A1X7TY56_AMPQE